MKRSKRHYRCTALVLDILSFRVFPCLDFFSLSFSFLMSSCKRLDKLFFDDSNECEFSCRPGKDWLDAAFRTRCLPMIQVYCMSKVRTTMASRLRVRGCQGCIHVVGCKISSQQPPAQVSLVAGLADLLPHVSQSEQSPRNKELPALAP